MMMPSLGQGEQMPEQNVWHYRPVAKGLGWLWQGVVLLFNAQLPISDCTVGTLRMQRMTALNL
jgi:hypothetical protein